MVEFSGWQLFQGRDNGPQCEGLDRRMKVVRRREKTISEVPPVASVTCSPTLKHAEGLAHMRRGGGCWWWWGSSFSLFYTHTHTDACARRIRSLKIPSRARKIYGRSDWLHRPPSTILRHCHLQRLMSPSALSNMAVSGIGGVGGLRLGEGEKRDGGREGGRLA